MPSQPAFRTTRLCGAILAMCAALAACGSDSDDPIAAPPVEETQPPGETTPPEQTPPPEGKRPPSA